MASDVKYNRATTSPQLRTNSMRTENQSKRPLREHKTAAERVDESSQSPSERFDFSRGASQDVVNDHAESHWLDILDRLGQYEDADDIHECDGIELDEIVEKSRDFRNLADHRLHVFPFKDVRPCWYRLYTDTSAIEAVKAVRRASEAVTRSTGTWLEEVVTMLDMAVITTGAYGREELFEEIYTRLETMCDVCDSEDPKVKRRKTAETLPTEEHSIPQLSCPVRHRFERPTLTAFGQFMNTLKEPAVLTGILEDWPATERWQSKGYWDTLTLAGRRLVPVETGRSYVDDDWGQRIVPFETFLERYIMQETVEKGYLAQYDLFQHLPRLNRDVTTPDYCFLDAPAPDPDTPVAKAKVKGGLKSAKPVSDDVQRNIWFGPAWTISPLHHDPYHNILCQVVGKKYVRLYAPRYSSRLYPRADDEPAPHGDGTIDMSNTSAVDIASIELSPHEDWDEKWPGLSEIPYQETILEAGQALYIPIGWWHYVRSCSVGISVSFWW